MFESAIFPGSRKFSQLEQCSTSPKICIEDHFNVNLSLDDIETSRQLAHGLGALNNKVVCRTLGNSPGFIFHRHSTDTLQQTVKYQA
jgi:hypothetical protein